MEIKRIAVSTDLSENSRSAFPVAASLARRFGAELDAVLLADFPCGDMKYWPTGNPVLGEQDYASYMEAVERQLAAFVAADHDLVSAGARPRLVREGTFDAYGEFLARESIDLVVAATHGRTGIRRAFLGSFAERLPRFAPCPALISRAPARGTSGPFSPARILVPTDFSPSNRGALEAAAFFARSFDAAARLFHVIEYQPGLYGLARDVSGTWRGFQEEATADVTRRFAEFVDGPSGKGVRAEFAVGQGGVVAEVLREAKDHRADLIVIGTHGRAGWDHFFMGSVAEQVLRRAPCPVLVVRGTEPPRVA